MPRYFGLDLHKAYVAGCEFRPDAPAGQQETHFRCPTTAEGWSVLLSHLGGDAVVAIEVTGNAFEVYDSLLPHVQEVVVANPLEMKRLGSGRHTDKVDAARLAKMLALGTLPRVWVPPQPVRAVRRLLSARERLMSLRTAVINQAKAVLRRHGIEAGALDPQDPEVHGLADALSPDERVVFLACLRQLATVEETVRDLEAEILSRLKEEPGFQHLLTITGVGPITAAQIWAAIGDPRRFRTGKQVARYAGLDPTVLQSGQVDRRGSISTNGSRRLRTALVEAAHSLGRFDTGALASFYARVGATKGKPKAAVALARKLLIIAWKIMLRGEDYRAAKPERLKVKVREVEQKVSRMPDWEALRAHLAQADESEPEPKNMRRRGRLRAAG